MSLHAARVRDAAVDDAISRGAFEEIPRALFADQAAEDWRELSSRPIDADCFETVMAYRKAKMLLAMQRGGLSPVEIARVFDA